MGDTGNGHWTSVKSSALHHALLSLQASAGEAVELVGSRALSRPPGKNTGGFTGSAGALGGTSGSAWVQTGFVGAAQSFSMASARPHVKSELCLKVQRVRCFCCSIGKHICLVVDASFNESRL
ncbi:hypothetical protein DPEC_G00245650 [Dallia pectoralis]|uniref:Uncharacterized protein n=1 Tax=Dallia pectoralis TaxID=75939 RepID=A0ACC2FWC0_DALPE|nr:hypothetical protein DPEC_G00245650 [Dallia pectoralis]